MTMTPRRPITRSFARAKEQQARRSDSLGTIDYASIYNSSGDDSTFAPSTFVNSTMRKENDGNVGSSLVNRVVCQPASIKDTYNNKVDIMNIYNYKEPVICEVALFDLKAAPIKRIRDELSSLLTSCEVISLGSVDITSSRVLSKWVEDAAVVNIPSCFNGSDDDNDSVSSDISEESVTGAVLLDLPSDSKHTVVSLSSIESGARLNKPNYNKKPTRVKKIFDLIIHMFVLYKESPTSNNKKEEEENETPPGGTFCETWRLPHSSMHGLWPSLYIEPEVKNTLLEYASSALLFSDKGVDEHKINWNRVVMLHGPPGTGKTSLCKALAHKLSIRLSNRFQSTQLLEVHAHELFSKWYSESGKLVTRLFDHIQKLAEQSETLVCVLIDEVESLVTARSKSSANGECSDAIRTVNALLTGLDRLKRFKNVIIFTTTNITGTLDLAFVDRADIKQFIGAPDVHARYEILRSCTEELQRVGMIILNNDTNKKLSLIPPYEEAIINQNEHFLNQEGEEYHRGSCVSTLLDIAEMAEGLSGRSLRKLPFQCHARYIRSPAFSTEKFFHSLKEAVGKEVVERELSKINCV